MLRLVFKRNDQQSAPGKENIGQRNGMLTTYFREGDYWPTLGGRFKSAYFCVDVEDTPENIVAAREMCEPVEEWLPDGKVDNEKSRARSGRIDFKTLETVLLSPGLDTVVQSSVEIEPVKATGLILSTINLDTKELPDARLDVRAVTSGSYTMGSAAQDYPNRATAYGDVGSPLIGSLTFTQETTISDAAGAALTETLDGNTFTDTCNTPPESDPTGGLIWSIAHNAHGATLQQEGNGTVDICFVYGKRTVAGAANNRSFYRVINVGAPPALQTVKIRKCLYDGNNLNGSGITVVDGSLVVEIKNNKIWDCPDDGIALLAGQGHASSVYENNTVRNCGVGLAAATEDGTFNNNAFYDCGTDVTNIGGGTGNNNSDTDGTAANGNWLAGAGNRTGTSLADFRSTDDTNTNFLDLKYGGGLVGAGTLAILADNTSGGRGRDRPNTEATVSIGCDEAIYPVITPPLIPASGDIAGGDSIDIDGVDFESSEASVTFGGTPVTSVDAQSNIQLTVTNPAHAAGAVDVIVTNDWGASVIGVGLFTYTGAPVPPTGDSIEDLSRTQIILRKKPNWATNPKRVIQMNRDLVEYEESSITIINISDFLIHVITYSYTFVNREEVFDYITFFNAQQGKLKRFWLPIIRNEFALVDPVSTFDGSLLVVDTGFAEVYQGYERIYLELQDGNLITRKVTGVVDNGDGTETLQLETLMDRDIALSEVNLFSRIMLVRFDKDALQLTHSTDAIAEVTMKYLELVREYEVTGEGS